MKINIKKTAIITLLAIGIAVNQPSCSTLTTNFHTVEKNKFYRSALLNTETLEKKIKECDINTVINLRGKKPGDEWYEDEKKLCEELNIKLVDIKFSSTPSKKEIKELIEAFDNAEYPICIHCYGGRDRTGLASTVYLVNKGKEPKEAFSQLTALKYRNVPLIDRRKRQKNFFEQYTDFCENNCQISFRQWLTEYYKEN